MQMHMDEGQNAASDGNRTLDQPRSPGTLSRTLILLLHRLQNSRLLRRVAGRRGTRVDLFRIFNLHVKARAEGLELIEEAKAMHFMARNTSIPVPKVHYAFTHKGASYLIMSYIDGQMAAKGWMKRTEESKRQILGQLRDMVAELRAVPPPAGTRVGNVHGGPINDPRLPLPHHQPHWGPFNTVREFHQALIQPLDFANPELVIPPDLAEVRELLEFYRQFPSGDTLVLTHGDLSSLNVLVRGDAVVGVVDWETAGWFPTYWEYTCAKYVNPQN
jgi:aminoglycoside phosphotransferase